jgi:hypothetical protein
MDSDKLSVAIAKVINEADVNVADGLYGLAIACAGCRPPGGTQGSRIRAMGEYGLGDHVGDD